MAPNLLTGQPNGPETLRLAHHVRDRTPACRPGAALGALGQALLIGIGLGLGLVAAPVRGVPDEYAWLGLGQLPSTGLLGAMVTSAARPTVAQAGPAALAPGDGVLEVAGTGRAAAAWRGAPLLADLDQVRQ